MNILITGGAGFIGSSLTEKLLKENNIIVIDNFDDYYDPKLKEQNISNFIKNRNYKLYRGSICNFELLKEIFSQNHIDAVIHLAACAGVRNSFINPLKYVKTNVEGTVNILENMKNYNVKKIVFASSSSVYGNCCEDKFNEDLVLGKPISPYASTKLAGEQLLYTYSNAYDISAICLRLFTVYGPKQRPDLAIRKFCELMKQDKPVCVYGDGTTIRDYTYIDDVVNAFCSAINYDKTKYEIINIGGNHPVTLNEMIKTLEKVTGKKAKIETMPLPIGDVNKTAADITKAQKLLNYNPQTSIEDGIKKFYESMISI